MSCRWSRDAGDYLTDDGEPCRRDDYGDRTRHCTARRSCSLHVGPDELTCPRCLGRTRQDIRAIRDFAALLPTAAVADGVDSEAANLSGPAADVEAWSWRKIAAKQGGSWHVSLIEDDDDWHPETILTRWQWMVSEDYGDDRVGTLSEAAEYLDRHLHRIAQDDGQDFPLLAREMRKCRQHLEAVLHNGSGTEKGAPCPSCAKAESPAFVRLNRTYGHWCTSDDCNQQFHFITEEGDVWICPKNRDHWWTAAGYAEMIERRTA